jgi:hypothetical protein
LRNHSPGKPQARPESRYIDQNMPLLALDQLAGGGTGFAFRPFAAFDVERVMNAIRTRSHCHQTK